MTDQQAPTPSSSDVPAEEAEARAEVAHAAADDATASRPDPTAPGAGGVPETGAAPRQGPSGAPDAGQDDGQDVDERAEEARAVAHGAAADRPSSEDPDADVAGPGEAPAEPPVDDPRSKEELLAALRAAEQQRDEYLKDVQRLQAEFENFRKRTMREGAGQRAAGVTELAGKLLDVLDDFDMALMSVDKTDDIAALHKGLELVYSKLISVLKGAGLQRIDDEGVTFDPERHEAVQQVKAEDGPLDEPQVVDVLRPGYEMQGRIIRAAMVKVAQ